MFSMLIMSMIMFMLSILMISMNMIFSKKLNLSREKKSPFECGFDPLSNSRIPFSIQFFMISLIFLIFDIEISLIIPLIYMFIFMNKFMIISSTLFILMLIMATLLEYMEKSMDWKF